MTSRYCCRPPNIKIFGGHRWTFLGIFNFCRKTYFRIEKYRPNSIEDLISHDDISKTISRFIDQDRLPHLLFYGPPGTGKTSTILAAAKRLYSRQFNSMVLEVSLCKTNIVLFNKFSSGKFKLVILDEADSMTKDAQNALRRIIEKFTENTRFCLICNYLSKIIPAIQSRCTKFRFAPLKVYLLLFSVRLTDDGVKAIFQFASGDMRKSINLLQVMSMYVIRLLAVSCQASCNDKTFIYSLFTYIYMLTVTTGSLRLTKN
ncbi:unnamed protein product [Trichobilharzia regenti]|nr:unnamed protein product [Trichobilharzia regenti]